MKDDRVKTSIRVNDEEKAAGTRIAKAFGLNGWTEGFRKAIHWFPQLEETVAKQKLEISELKRKLELCQGGVRKLDNALQWVATFSATPDIDDNEEEDDWNATDDEEDEE